MVAIVAAISAIVCMTVLFFMTRSRGRSPFWALFGLIGLLGLGIGAAIIYGTGSKKANTVVFARQRLEHGEISEDEYWRAVEGKRDAA